VVPLALASNIHVVKIVPVPFWTGASQVEDRFKDANLHVLQASDFTEILGS
jgi:hypothetical protein